MQDPEKPPQMITETGHPLAFFALAILRSEVAALDARSLAEKLAGGTPSDRDDVARAYDLVAQDVLGVLTDAGHLTHGENGWDVLEKDHPDNT